MNITRAPFTRQYEHVGNIRHGVQTGPWRVEFTAPVKNVEASLDICQGSVVSLDADGEFVIGCPAGSGVNRPVPFISMKNIKDPDVTTGIEGRTQRTDTVSAMGGNIIAIPCTSGYELETTEFDIDAVYAPNDGLTASAATPGLVTRATEAPGASEVYLGFVSNGPRVDYLDNPRLAFFANFIPALIGAGTGTGTGA